MTGWPRRRVSMIGRTVDADIKRNPFDIGQVSETGVAGKPLTKPRNATKVFLPAVRSTILKAGPIGLSEFSR